MIAFTERFFWTMVWIFLTLIVGFWLLGIIQEKGDGSIFGRLAGWISSHAEPQY